MARAYVPEHIPSLMVPISKGTAFLLEDYVGYFMDNWVILVGYPLRGEHSSVATRRVVEAVLEFYQPEHFWYIGGEAPDCLADHSIDRESDWYYQLSLGGWEPEASLQRSVRRGLREVRIEVASAFGQEHEALVVEMMKNVDLPPLAAELYRAMPEYISLSESALVLEARDKRDALSAFFVVDVGAVRFDTYVLGAYSRENYVPNASDALFYKMISLSRERQKEFINLGLGVNQGIRRFKTKWGGVPVLPYEYCGCHYPRSRTQTLIDMLLGGKL